MTASASSDKSVTVRYFAAVREAVGTASEQVQTDASTVAALRAELRARGGAFASQLADERPLRVALNQVMLREDQPLGSGDEVAFFPPVTGG